MGIYLVADVSKRNMAAVDFKSMQKHLKVMLKMSAKPAAGVEIINSAGADLNTGNIGTGVWRQIVFHFVRVANVTMIIVE